MDAQASNKVGNAPGIVLHDLYRGQYTSAFNVLGTSCAKLSGWFQYNYSTNAGLVVNKP